MNTSCLLNAVMILTLLSASVASGAAGPPAGPPRIEVCFVLDTTGSMGGLIEGAKLKIWTIANQLVSAKPVPQLKIALIGYRDRGDEYIVRRHDLNADIDAVYADLQRFSAGGGGDTPESVNQALYEAVTRVGWSTDRGVLRLVFLVGDSPPHMDYQDDVKYAQTCELAVKKDLIINTVQCGANSATTPIWEDIAKRAEGKFVAIGQTGDMQVVSTPMDEELARLNVAIGRTLVPYGAMSTQREVAAKQAAAEAAAPLAVADRLAYNARTGMTVQGGGDLVDDMKSKKVGLARLKNEELPPELRKLTAAQREAYLKDKSEERTKLQGRIDELLKQRQAFITEQMRRQSKTGGFDEEVRAIVAAEAKAKGIQYELGAAKK